MTGNLGTQNVSHQLVANEEDFAPTHSFSDLLISHGHGLCCTHNSTQISLASDSLNTVATVIANQSHIDAQLMHLANPGHSTGTNKILIAGQQGVVDINNNLHVAITL